MTPTHTARRLAIGAAVGLCATGVGFAWRASRTQAAPGDAGALAALRAAMEASHLTPGTYRILDSHGSRERVLAPDPEDPRVVLCRFPEAPERWTAFHRQMVSSRLWWGEWASFERNFLPLGPPDAVHVSSHPGLRVRFGIAGRADGPVREIVFDPESRAILRCEDRAFDGSILHACELVAEEVGEALRTLPEGAERDDLRARAIAAEARRTAAPEAGPTRYTSATVAWQAFLERVPLPLYEPTRVPRGYARRDWFYDGNPLAGDEDRRPIDLVRIGYVDGQTRLDLFIARSEDLDRLDRLAERAARGGGTGTCSGNLDDVPEEVVVEGENAIRIRRKSDRCRTVLRRDFADVGMSVAMVTFNTRRREAYEETMRSLVRVRDSKAAPAPRDR